MNWIHLAQDRVQQSALVNIVQVLVQTLGHIPKNAECTNVEQNFFFLNFFFLVKLIKALVKITLIKHFNFQLTHTTLKKLRVIKIF